MELSTPIQSCSLVSSSTYSSCMADAQQLNNFATLYIETGHYENAIVVLQEALRLWEEHRMRKMLSTTQSVWCSCSSCTLDGCIAFSEKQQQNLSNRKCQMDSDNSYCSATDNLSGAGTKKRRLSTEKALILNKHDDCQDAANISLKRKTPSFCKTSSGIDDSNHGYTYRNPIRIPKRHNMGSTCFFIILFNLTLANHLKVLNATTEVRKDEIKDVLNLYELIFEYWSRLKADRSAERKNDIANSSLRFVMILFNNMSQMYRIVENVTKHRQCLENLLSMVMVAIECNARLTSIRHMGNDEEGVQYHQTFQQSIEGFLTNVMPPQQSAEAA